VLAGQRVKENYRFGTMIEVPRAGGGHRPDRRVHRIFSFGTNDLTQMMFGVSRDDSERI